MKTGSLHKFFRYNHLTIFGSVKKVFCPSSSILYRNFTTTDINSSEGKNYYEELVEKSNALLDQIKVSESELLQNKDVVVYIRNRTCRKCNKTVKISHPEFIENACADSWRYFHKFSYIPNCPIYGVMKFTKYSKLRTEQKVVISND